MARYKRHGGDQHQPAVATDSYITAKAQSLFVKFKIERLESNYAAQAIKYGYDVSIPKDNLEYFSLVAELKKYLAIMEEFKNLAKLLKITTLDWDYLDSIAKNMYTSIMEGYEDEYTNRSFFDGPRVVEQEQVVKDTPERESGKIKFSDITASFELFCSLLKIPYRRGFGTFKGDVKAGPLFLAEAQKIICYIMIKYFFVKKLPVRLQILKSRQLGMTTVLVAFWVWLSIQVSDFTMMFMIDKGSHLIEKRSFIITSLDMLAEMFPGEVPTIVERSSNHIKLSNGFRFLFESAEASNPATSEKLDGLHMSERPKWPRGRSQQVTTSITPSISSGPYSIIVDEGTAEDQEDFYSDWQELHDPEISKITSTIPIFFPWFISKEYSLKPPSDSFDDNGNFIYLDDNKDVCECDSDGTILLTESDYKIKYGLTIEQIYWRRKKILSPAPDGFRRDQGMFNQEYPTTPEHAWSQTGKKYLAAGALAKAKRLLMDPIFIGFIRDAEYNELKGKLCQDYTLVKPVLDESDAGDLSIFEHPVKDKKYYIGGDVCEGLQVELGQKRDPDYTAIAVLDQDGFVCARLKNRCLPEDLPRVLICLGVYYNLGMINCERNKDGATVWSWFYPSNYPNIFFREDNTGFGVKSELAWSKITPDQRIVVLNVGRGLIHESPERVRDKVLYLEAASLVRRKDGQVQPYGSHDDVYFALCHAEEARISDLGHRSSVGDEIVNSFEFGHHWDTFSDDYDSVVEGKEDNEFYSIMKYNGIDIGDGNGKENWNW